TTIGLASFSACNLASLCSPARLARSRARCFCPARKGKVANGLLFIIAATLADLRPRQFSRSADRRIAGDQRGGAPEMDQGGRLERRGVNPGAAAFARGAMAARAIGRAFPTGAINGASRWHSDSGRRRE